MAVRSTPLGNAGTGKMEEWCSGCDSQGLTKRRHTSLILRAAKVYPEGICRGYGDQKPIRHLTLERKIALHSHLT